ncbi:ATP-binding cassette domain-containing protein [Lactobacillus delbrueckii subsp. bulgaricus]|nr:ABC transporter [Lactobacillus delbrueckii subsp. bulgaricus]MBT8816416.1 ABC transporter [Lactobacillus delbrueckii subsp. bulgaricus]MBT8841907.1 ABC transporter [Lactobacillus delbrueckii subsp. bulgaricus]MBT8858713.1 ABC transporter [Lactobacillus delbrueckii subsp. bulgaricus]MBT8862358.1 ABC transporter [Lactobacillus delbrueckii subsp. bulgaricus]
MKNAIEVRNLSKSYGDLKVVNDISFVVREGELFAFLGPNGAGKSTTVDCLSTLTKFDSGEIKLSGLNMKTQAQEIKQRIGIVFQEGLLDKRLTVLENLTLRAGFYYHSKAEVKAAVARASEYTEINDLLKRQYGKLSGGQRRRVDIARALLNTPKILFLDEPTTGLDPQTRQHIWETIQRLQKEQGITIFLTTHYMAEASAADYVVILDHGKIVAEGSPISLKELYSYDRLKLYPKKEQNLDNILSSLSLNWNKAADHYEVELRNTMDAIDIVEGMRDQLQSFEVLHGTMDDVFLNITGRRLRE